MCQEVGVQRDSGREKVQDHQAKIQEQVQDYANSKEVL